MNKITSTTFIFILLTTLFLSRHLNGNEEQYMQLAKQFVNPNWIFESQNLTEVAGTRILYQLIIGSVLQYLSFETTKLIFSFILILCFSSILGKIYKLLYYNNIKVLTHLGFFIIIFKQSFFGESWMLISVEPKGFCYPLILFSFYYVLKKEHLKALLVCVLASYFHILIGGYTIIYILLTFLLFKKENNLNLKQLFKGALMYFILILPYLIYLKYTALNYNAIENKISPSWIYTNFRAPHHTALFKNIKYFYNTHFYGIIMHIVGLLLTILMYNAHKYDRKLKFITQFTITSMAFTLLLVIIAIFDKNGEITKFYLYRINTLSTFFLSLLIATWVFEITKNEYYKKLQVVILIIFISLFIKPFISNIETNIVYYKSEKILNNISKFVKNNTDREELIFSFDEHLSLIRKTERNFYVVHKYIPAEVNKINDWYNRIQIKNEIKKDPLKLKEIVEMEHINYIITPRRFEKPFDYKVVYTDQYFIIYATDI